MIISNNLRILSMFRPSSVVHTCIAHKNFGLYLPVPASYCRHAESQLIFRVGVFHCTVALVLLASKCKVTARPCPDYSRSGIYSYCSWTHIPGNKFQYTHMPYHCRTTSTVVMKLLLCVLAATPWQYWTLVRWRLYKQ